MVESSVLTAKEHQKAHGVADVVARKDRSLLPKHNFLDRFGRRRRADPERQRAEELQYAASGMVRTNLGLQVGEGRPNADWNPEPDNSAGVAVIRDRLERVLEGTKDEIKRERIRHEISELRPVLLPQAPDPNPPAEILRDLSSPKKVLVPQGEPMDIQEVGWEELPDEETADRGQRLGVLTANWNKKDKPVNVFWGNYMNKHSEGESNYRLVELAHQMPEYPLLAIDYPQFGNSDKLTDEQRDDFSLVLDAQLRVMKKLGVKDANFMGMSQGGFTALEAAVMANKYGITVHTVIDAEGPGVKKMSKGRLMVNTVREFAALPLYHSHPEDPRMIKAAGMLNPIREQLTGMVKGFARVLFKEDPWLRQVGPMAEESIEANATQLLSEQGDSIDQLVFINGSESTVSPERDVNRIAQNLEALDGGKYKNKIRRILYPGMGHLAQVNARVFASNVRLILEGSSLPETPIEDFKAA